jgi:hypothetical protein
MGAKTTCANLAGLRFGSLCSTFPASRSVSCPWCRSGFPSDVVGARWTDISLGDRNSIPYPVTDPNAVENRLTVADSRTAPQRIVPRSEWSFARLQNGGLVTDPRRIYLKSGFEPGAYYRFVYRTSDPYVVGVSLAAVRDLMSWVRHDHSCKVHLCLRRFAERSLPAPVLERGFQRRPRRPHCVRRHDGAYCWRCCDSTR